MLCFVHCTLRGLLLFLCNCNKVISIKKAFYNVLPSMLIKKGECTLLCFTGILLAPAVQWMPASNHQLLQAAATLAVSQSLQSYAILSPWLSTRSNRRAAKWTSFKCMSNTQATTEFSFFPPECPGNQGTGLHVGRVRSPGVLSATLLPLPPATLHLCHSVDS